MNDALRFRVWDKVFNQYWTEEVIKENAAWLLFPNNTNINDVKIERCTGLKDKNGKPIYEGDILYCMLNCPRKGVVEFYRNAFCLNENGSYSEDIVFSDKCCEVVGNIHEKPELLKESE